MTGAIRMVRSTIDALDERWRAKEKARTKLFASLLGVQFAIEKGDCDYARERLRDAAVAEAEVFGDSTATVVLAGKLRYILEVKP